MFSGHAAPSASCTGEAVGDKATDVSSQEGNKSMLVMSGGEGYIDFRMGEFATCSRWNIFFVSAADGKTNVSVCV